MPNGAEIQALNEKIALQKNLMAEERRKLVTIQATEYSPLYKKQIGNLKHIEAQLEHAQKDEPYIAATELVVYPEPRAASCGTFFSEIKPRTTKARSQSVDDVAAAKFAV